MMLEKNWHRMSSDTHWKLEKFFKSFKSNPRLKYNKHDDNYLMKEIDIDIEIQPSSSVSSNVNERLVELLQKKGMFHSANNDVMIDINLVSPSVAYTLLRGFGN